MARKFFVGGTSGGTFTWPIGTASNANWSTSSGGAGGAGLPTASDVVVFDNNSGTGAFTVNRTATAALQGIEITRTNGIVTISGSTAWTLNGGSGAAINIPAGTTYNWTNTGVVSITGTSTINAPAGVLSPININGSGITVTLAGNFLSFRTLTLTQGTIDLSTFVLTTQYLLSASSGGARAITFGAGSYLYMDNNVASAVSLDLSPAPVTLNGTANVSIQSYNAQTRLNAGTPITSNRFNFTGVGAGSVALLNLYMAGDWGDVNVSGINNLNVNTGTIMKVSGALNLTSLSSFTGTGTVTFDGANQTLTTGGLTVTPPITISGSGTFTFGDNLTCSGAITQSGTVSVQQGSSTAVNVTALTLNRSGTNTWDTRGGTITVTGTNTTVLLVQTGATFTSNAAVTFSGSPTTGTRTVNVANPASGGPTVNLTLSGSDTITYTSTVLNSLTATGFTGTFAGNLTLYTNNALTGITYPTLALTVYLGAGNTASLTVNAINTVSCGSGTLNLTNTSTIPNLTSVGGALVFTPATAYSATSVTCSNSGSITFVPGLSTVALGTVTVNSGTVTANATGALSASNITLNTTGTLNLGKPLSVSATLTFAGGVLVRNGHTVTVGTVRFSAGTYSGLVGAGITATNLTVEGTGQYTTAANFGVTGTIQVNAGTLALAGFTATCQTFIQSGGVLNFGAAGALKATFSLNVNQPATSTGTGLLYLDGVYNGGSRSVSGDGYTSGVVLNNTAGTSPDINFDVGTILTDLDTGTLTQPITGELGFTGTVILGNHDASAVSVTAFGGGGSLSTTTPAQGVGALSVFASGDVTLASDFKVIGATSLSDGSTLSFDGYQLETGTFSGYNGSTTVNSVLAFGGGGKLRILGGSFSGYSATSDVTTTGTGVIELAGVTSNTFEIGPGSGSYAGVTLNLASAPATSTTISTNGIVLGNLTNTASGMTVFFAGTGANSTTLNAYSLQNVSISSGVYGVAQGLAYAGAGTVSVYNNLISNIAASPSATWTAYNSINGGNNTNITFAGAPPPSEGFTRAVRSFANPAAA